jgi:hypothetical protein
VVTLTQSRFNQAGVHKAHCYPLFVPSCSLVVLQVKQDGNKLTIESPVGARTGVYMCTASGDGGIAQRQMFQVRGAPEIEHSATNKNLMEGEKAVLKCDVVGYPTPAIKWQKKDTETGDTTPVGLSFALLFQ